MMVTRLQAHICGSPMGGISGGADRVHFCVRAAVFLVPSLPHALPITRQDTADHRIGGAHGPIPAPAKEAACRSHSRSDSVRDTSDRESGCHADERRDRAGIVDTRIAGQSVVPPSPSPLDRERPHEPRDGYACEVD